ncbi:MAG TPA: glutamate--tRNA ligase, partial [Elusimicrobiales bacterium]|nr:glutamate--tRNA ligase [Elusimicrobiales bacterium]
FILRIEDTDQLRSNAEFEKSIFEGLKWMGLDWDEGPTPNGEEKGSFGPYLQSKRVEKEIYKPFVEKLLSQDKAYFCYCSEKELADMREKAQLEKRPPKYDMRCRNLTPEQRKQKEDEGLKPVIRFKMPQSGTTVFNDAIRGEVKFENKLLYDLILVKASGYPTYNFACVVDDYLMKITQVIRGDDHLTNTAHQFNIYKALGFKTPEFIHLSMIHASDGTKLSKRHGHTNVIEYKDKGFLPVVLRNYLALLGWSTSDSQQIFKEGELESKFDIKGCQKSPSMFDLVKLTWMNGEYIRMLSPEGLKDLAMPFIEKAGIEINVSDEKLTQIIALEQEKYKLLSEIPHLIEFFFTDKITYRDEDVKKIFKKPDVGQLLGEIKLRYEKLNDFSESAIEQATRDYAKENQIKTGQIFHPLRLAVSGRTQGPTLFKMIEYIGKSATLERILKAIGLCD